MQLTVFKCCVHKTYRFFFFDTQNTSTTFSHIIYKDDFIIASVVMENFIIIKYFTQINFTWAINEFSYNFVFQSLFLSIYLDSVNGFQAVLVYFKYNFLLTAGNIILNNNPQRNDDDGIKR